MMLKNIRNITGLRIGVFNDPVLIPLIENNFPNAKIVIINDFTSNGIAQVFAEKKCDAVFWSQNQTEFWALGHPGYSSVSPEGVIAPLLMGYMIPANSPQFLNFLNYWLELKKNDGFQGQLNNHWLLARPQTDTQPRWSILRNVLHFQ